MTILNQQQINNLISELQTIAEISNIEERISKFIKNWENLPEPKYEQPEQLSELIIYCIYEEYMAIGDYNNAKSWAIKGINSGRANDPISSYEYMQMGRVCYELEEYDEAMKYFSIAYERGKKRAFQGFDKKYWEFYSKNKK